MENKNLETTNEKSKKDDEAGVASGRLALGAVIDDRYEVLAHIGSGGMGEVYKVLDRTTQSVYALKMISPRLAEQKILAKRLEHEAQAARTLVHGNIVSVYDVGTSTDGAPYLIMDYIEGDSLENLLVKEALLTPKRALPIFIQIAEALVHAQQKSIVHRDLKPSNILLTRTPGGEDMVKIVDFGIAKVSDQDRADKTKLTQTGELLGTPLYMSPEQCTGEDLDARSDIYSFGCIMHEVLTGKSPFAADNPVKVILKHLNDNPPSIPSNLGVSSDLKELIGRCLEKHRADRYQSAVDVHIDLERVLDNRKIRAHKRRRRITRRTKLVASAVALSMLGALTGIFVIQSISSRNEKRPVAAQQFRPEQFAGKTMSQWTNAIEQDPDDPHLYFYRGMLHAARDERTNAIDDFSQAINLKPTYLEAYKHRAFMYNMTAQYEKADADANKLIELNPGSATSYETRAEVFHFRDQFSESAGDWKKALAIDNNEYYYYGLAQELMKLAKYKEGQEAIGIAIAGDPKQGTYAGISGLMYAFTHEFDKAHKMLKLATESPRARGVEWTELAYYYACVGKLAEGEEAIERAKSLETFPARAYRLAGEYYRSSGQFEKAIKEFNASTSLEEYPPGYRERAAAYMSQGQWRSAHSDLKKSLKLNPYSPKTLAFLAQVESKLGMRKEADEHIAQAIKGKELEPIIYVSEASVELDKGNEKKALDAASRAIELDPWLKEGYEMRSEIRKRLNDIHGADKDRKKAGEMLSRLDY